MWSYRAGKTRIAGFAGALILLAGSAVAQAPNIEGTYHLVSRTLKDGRVIAPPEVIGLQTYTKKYRQFNIVSKDPEGNVVSRSIIATYTLTPAEYTETPLLHVLVRGQEVRNLSGQPQRSTVKVEGGRMTLAPREFEQRTTMFEANGFTATSAENVDRWEKIE
jgi:hypothetical protein